jgi:hypothetical protein
VGDRFLLFRLLRRLLLRLALTWKLISVPKINLLRIVWQPKRQNGDIALLSDQVNENLLEGKFTVGVYHERSKMKGLFG